MKALKIFSLFGLLFSGQVMAANLYLTNPTKTHKASKLEKTTIPVANANLLKFLVFDLEVISTKPDTSLTNTIKPDFDSVILPENKLWLRKSER